MVNEKLKKLLLAIAGLFVLCMLFWGVVSLNQIGQELRDIEYELHHIAYELDGLDGIEHRLHMIEYQLEFLK